MQSYINVIDVQFDYLWQHADTTLDLDPSFHQGGYLVMMTDFGAGTISMWGDAGYDTAYDALFIVRNLLDWDIQAGDTRWAYEVWHVTYGEVENNYADYSMDWVTFFNAMDRLEYASLPF